MTNEEALQELKASIVGYGFQCHIETYQVAISALDKQTPKKVIQHGEEGDDDCWFECPNCHHYVTGYWRGDDNYCTDCGQAISWSEPNCSEKPNS